VDRPLKQFQLNIHSKQKKKRMSYYIMQGKTALSQAVSSTAKFITNSSLS